MFGWEGENFLCFARFHCWGSISQGLNRIFYSTFNKLCVINIQRKLFINTAFIPGCVTLKWCNDNKIFKITKSFLNFQNQYPKMHIYLVIKNKIMRWYFYLLYSTLPEGLKTSLYLDNSNHNIASNYPQRNETLYCFVQKGKCIT